MNLSWLSIKTVQDICAKIFKCLCCVAYTICVYVKAMIRHYVNILILC